MTGLAYLRGYSGAVAVPGSVLGFVPGSLADNVAGSVAGFLADTVAGFVLCVGLRGLTGPWAAGSLG